VQLVLVVSHMKVEWLKLNVQPLYQEFDALTISDHRITYVTVSLTM